MKSSVAAFSAAAAAFLAARGPGFAGRISLILTGDEEGPAIRCTSTSPSCATAAMSGSSAPVITSYSIHYTKLYEIGRRGSITAFIAVRGVQGHVAYPERADNPVHRLVCILDELTSKKLDAGDEHFPPSSLAVTTVDVGNPVITSYSIHYTKLYEHRRFRPP